MLRFDRERGARRAFVGSLLVAIVADGAVHPLGAEISLVLFAGVPMLAGGSLPHRPVLVRTGLGSIAVAWALVALALWQSTWRSDTAAANPVWSHLAEQFGAAGGTIAVDRWQAVWTLPAVVLPFLAYAAAVMIFRRRRDAKNLWMAVALIGFAFAVYGILQRTLFPTWHFLWERTAYTDSLSGFYVNRNPAAAFLILTTLATLAVVDDLASRLDLFDFRRSFHRERRWTADERRIVLLLAIAATELLALLLTRSRAGVMIGLVAVGGFAALRLPPHLARARLTVSRRAGLVLLVAAVLLLSILADQVFFRLERQGFDDESRFCLWGSVAKMAIDNLPWGIGMGSFADAFPSYRSPDCGLLGVWETAHDGYLQGLATIGLAFPVVIGAIALSLIPPLVGALRSGTGGFATAVLIATAALALHSLVDFPLEIPANAVLFAALIASAIGMATDPRVRADHQRHHGRRPPLAEEIVSGRGFGTSP